MTEHVHEWAKRFHDEYERLAPEYGYITREDTKQFDPASPNGKLMMAVIESLGIVPRLNECEKLKVATKDALGILYNIPEDLSSWQTTNASIQEAHDILREAYADTLEGK